MRMRKPRMKFTDSHVTSEGAGLNGWFNGKWGAEEIIIHRENVSMPG
jgi:hypothetical protein